MAFIRLDIADFRNLLSVKLEPISQGFNFIYGNNGSGKTSLLEAIYYLSLGRSFRSTVISRIIRTSASKLNLFAQVVHPSDKIVPVGVLRDQNGELRIRISGEDVHSTAELANLTAVQLINSNCFNLLEAPSFRRKYLDWGTFYSTPEFIRVWKRFDKALKQRNAGLRNEFSSLELKAWTQELTESSILLNQIRTNYVENIIPALLEFAAELLNISDVQISFYPGWNDRISYDETLVQTLERDRLLGFTQMGPHRADFKVNINGVPVKDIFSRGQQKLFVCAMILAQGALLHSHTNKQPIYLVDDLAAELDITSRSNLMALLHKQKAQIFVTAVERETLEGFLPHCPMKMFHVEHGEIREANNES